MVREIHLKRIISKELLEYNRYSSKVPAVVVKRWCVLNWMEWELITSRLEGLPNCISSVFGKGVTFKLFRKEKEFVVDIYNKRSIVVSMAPFIEERGDEKVFLEVVACVKGSTA